jgi:glycosyltransferase involved in cell wall biosynthesis
MKPYISVMIPTIRVGGLDVLFSSLENQTFKDFELVLVDSLYEYRKDIVAKVSLNHSFRIKHVPSLGNKLTATQYSRALNTGVINCSGQIMYTICDYAWLDPNCLELHANFHKNEKSDKNYGYICSYNVGKLPKLHKDFDNIYAGNTPYDTPENKIKFVEQEMSSFNNYINDLNSGKLNSLMYSIFNSPFTIESSSSIFEIIDHKVSPPLGITSTSNCFIRNESYVLEDVIAINGFNEALDGSYGWNDWEFLDRLQARLGTKLYNNPAITTIVIDCRKIMYGRLRERDVFANEAIWKHGKATNFKDNVNTWSLKDMRDINEQ